MGEGQVQKDLNCCGGDSDFYLAGTGGDFEGFSADMIRLAFQKNILRAVKGDQGSRARRPTRK